jgi:hypothetical protein
MANEPHDSFVYSNQVLPLSQEEYINIGYRKAINDIRTSILAGSYHGLSDGQNVAKMRYSDGELQVQLGPSTTWTNISDTGGALNALRVSAYGAVGDGVTDDSAAIQECIDAATAAHKAVLFDALTYAIGTELDVTVHTILLGSGYSGGARTTLKAISAIRSVINFEVAGVVQVYDMTINGNHLAEHGFRLRNCAGSYFSRIEVNYAWRDGIFMPPGADPGPAFNNDKNIWFDCYFSGNGTLYLTTGLMATYGDFVSLQIASVRIGESVATTNGSDQLVGTGTSFVSWGLRPGDPIRIGGTARYNMVYSVQDETHLTMMKNDTVTASGQDFAIGCGDGYHEGRAGDNNIAHFINGIHRLNAGFGFGLDGLYGHTFDSVQIDNYSMWGVRIGTEGGNPVITGTFNHCYFEGVNKPFALVAAQDWMFVAPLAHSDMAASIDFIPTEATSHGWYFGGGKISPIGSAYSDIPSTQLGRIGAGGTINGPIYVVGGQLTVTGTTINPNGLVVALNASSDQTINTLTADGIYGELVYLINNAPTYKMTFNTGAGLILRSSSLVLQYREVLAVYHLGGGVWLEAGRSASTQQPGAVDSGTIAAGTAIVSNAEHVTVAPGSNITITATPSLVDGLVDHQRVTIFNTATNTLTLQDRGTLVGSKLRLTAGTVVLGQYDSITLVWLGGMWNQTPGNVL